MFWSRRELRGGWGKTGSVPMRRNKFLGTSADGSVNITSRTDFALTAAGFLEIEISTICTCEPLNYSAHILALGSARNSCMATLVHCVSDRSDRPRPKLNMPVRIV